MHLYRLGELNLVLLNRYSYISLIRVPNESLQYFHSLHCQFITIGSGRLTPDSVTSVGTSECIRLGTVLLNSVGQFPLVAVMSVLSHVSTNESIQVVECTHQEQLKELCVAFVQSLHLFNYNKLH